MAFHKFQISGLLCIETRHFGVNLMSTLNKMQDLEFFSFLLDIGREYLKFEPTFPETFTNNYMHTNSHFGKKDHLKNIAKRRRTSLKQFMSLISAVPSSSNVILFLFQCQRN